MSRPCGCMPSGSVRPSPRRPSESGCSAPWRACAPPGKRPMSAPESIFERRARRAYELGRLGAGARRAALLLFPIALALPGCGAPQEVLVCGGALLVAVTLFLWRGQDWKAGVGPGIAAGLAPLLLPVFTRGAGHLCGP